MKVFNHKQYWDLLIENPKMALQYRVDCWLVKKTENIEENKKTLGEVTPKTEKNTLEEQITPNSTNSSEIEELRAEYKEKYGKNPSSKMKLETLIKKLV